MWYYSMTIVASCGVRNTRILRILMGENEDDVARSFFVRPMPSALLLLVRVSFFEHNYSSQCVLSTSVAFCETNYYPS